MGRKYEWDKNPLQDFLFQLIMVDDDIAEISKDQKFNDTILYILRHIGIQDEDIVYLDYEVRKIGVEGYRLMAKNIVTALWFTGYFPKENDLIFENNTTIFDKKKFKFNKKTKKLTWIKKEA